MATVYDPNQDEENSQNPQEQQEQGPTPTQPVMGGESGNIQGGAPSAPASPTAAGPKAAKQGSGRFLNIQKYLSANTSADYAGKIGQNVQQQQDKLNQGIQSAQQGIQSAYQPEAQRLQNAGQTVESALGNLQNLDQQQIEEFNKLRTGQVNSQIGVQNEAELQQQAKKQAEQAELAQSEQGRFQLLKNTLGTPTYNRGQNKLDQLLLQSQSGQLKTLGATTSKAAQEAGKSLEQVRAEAAARSGELQQLGTAAQSQAQEAVTARIAKEQQDLEARRANAEAGRQRQLEMLQGDLGKFNVQEGIDRQLAEATGLAGLEGTNLYGLSGQDLLKYMTPQQMAISQGQVALPEDVARFQALAKLSGQNELAQYLTPEAGPSALGGLDTRTLQSDLAARQSMYQSAIESSGAPRFQEDLKQRGADIQKELDYISAAKNKQYATVADKNMAMATVKQIEDRVKARQQEYAQKQREYADTINSATSTFGQAAFAWDPQSGTFKPTNTSPTLRIR